MENQDEMSFETNEI